MRQSRNQGLCIMKYNTILMVATTVFVALSTYAEERPPDRISVMVWGMEPGLKGKGVRSYCNMRFENPRDTEVWILFPIGGDNRLPADGILKIHDPRVLPISSRRYFGKDGDIVLVCVDEEFYALRIPAKGCVEALRFTRFSFDALVDIEVMETEQLLVNGKTPVEEWIPYPTISGKNVTIDFEETADADLNKDPQLPKKVAAKYPNETVESVRAAKFKIWKIRF